jgi:hypothetical protein
MSEFSGKQRQRFRRLLEVAHSTTFDGEREAALGAATRLAESLGMTLREAAGMAESEEPRAPAHRKPPPKPEPWPESIHPRNFHDAFRARHGMHARRAETDLDEIIADKKRFEKAMQDAINRGLDADERRRRARMAAIEASARKRSSRRWRPRAEFVRVLLKETRMSVREVAATAGVSVYDVLREKLLLRSSV